MGVGRLYQQKELMAGCFSFQGWGLNWPRWGDRSLFLQILPSATLLPQQSGLQEAQVHFQKGPPSESQEPEEDRWTGRHEIRLSLFSNLDKSLDSRGLSFPSCITRALS